MIHLRHIARLAFVATALACAPSEGARVDSAADTASTTVAPSAIADDSVVLARADSSRIKGSPTAALWIVEISDFQCPYCRMWHDSTYEQLMREYVETGRVRFAYLNLPLPIHANATPAAEAAMCAGLQGKFWEMHDALFQGQAQWASSANPWAVFAELASSRGIDPLTMRACGDADTVLPLVQADAARAMEAGVQSTPTFLVGSVMLEGAYPFGAMKRVVDSLLAPRGP